MLPLPKVDEPACLGRMREMFGAVPAGCHFCHWCAACVLVILLAAQTLDLIPEPQMKDGDDGS